VGDPDHAVGGAHVRVTVPDTVGRADAAVGAVGPGGAVAGAGDTTTLAAAALVEAAVFVPVTTHWTARPSSAACKV
jgi:hypothetical protein